MNFSPVTCTSVYRSRSCFKQNAKFMKGHAYIFLAKCFGHMVVYGVTSTWQGQLTCSCILIGGQDFGLKRLSKSSHLWRPCLYDPGIDR